MREQWADEIAKGRKKAAHQGRFEDYIAASAPVDRAMSRKSGKKKRTRKRVSGK